MSMCCWVKSRLVVLPPCSDSDPGPKQSPGLLDPLCVLWESTLAYVPSICHQHLHRSLSFPSSPPSAPFFSNLVLHLPRTADDADVLGDKAGDREMSSRYVSVATIQWWPKLLLRQVAALGPSRPACVHVKGRKVICRYDINLGFGRMRFHSYFFSGIRTDKTGSFNSA